MYALIIHPLPEGKTRPGTKAEKIRAVRSVRKALNQSYSLEVARYVLDNEDESVLGLTEDHDEAEQLVDQLIDAGFYYDDEPENPDAPITKLAEFVTADTDDPVDHDEEVDGVIMDEPQEPDEFSYEAAQTALVAMALCGGNYLQAAGVLRMFGRVTWDDTFDVAIETLSNTFPGGNA